jgi:hypothetical protein
VDNNAIADGFQLYLHSFVVTKTGAWAVVQQGMNPASGMARRYHWHSADIRDFTCEPHSGIIGKHQGTILNLVDKRAKTTQDALLEIAHQPVSKSLAEVRKLTMPAHHHLRAADVDLNRLGAVLAVAHERELRDFASLLLVEGLGPRTLQALALVAEVIHGAPARFSDPARFSFAHGGKDGHPFPVPLKTYDETLAVLRRSLGSARVGNQEKVEAFRRLDQLVRAVERQLQPIADFNSILAHEHSISSSLQGHTASGPHVSRTPSGQLRLRFPYSD